jgi:hypothetical protein
MRFHHNYSRVQEAIEDPETWRCIRWIQGEMREGRIIGADDAVLREAAELHPGVDRDLLRDYFWFRPLPGGRDPLDAHS